MAWLSGRLKVADFGWSCTLDYLAPKMVENKAQDYAVDNWTLGILCYEFLYGVHHLRLRVKLMRSKGMEVHGTCV